MCVYQERRDTICIYEYIECSFHERVELFFFFFNSTYVDVDVDKNSFLGE